MADETTTTDEETAGIDKNPNSQQNKEGELAPPFEKKEEKTEEK